jgi:hypothetical protein
MSSDGMHWQPYVGEVARTLLSQVMADHYPADGTDRLHLTVIIDTTGYGQYERLHGELLGVDEAALTFTDGTRVLLEELVSFDI